MLSLRHQRRPVSQSGRSTGNVCAGCYREACDTRISSRARWLAHTALHRVTPIAGEEFACYPHQAGGRRNRDRSTEPGAHEGTADTTTFLSQGIPKTVAGQRENDGPNTRAAHESDTSRRRERAEAQSVTLD